MTTFSPCDAGSVDTRRSTRFPLMATRARPSCGRSRSAMSSCAMILMRDTSGMPASFGSTISCRSTPSMRYRTATPLSSGSRWMSDARDWMPRAMIESTSWITGRSPARVAAISRLASSAVSERFSMSYEPCTFSRILSNMSSGRYSSSMRSAMRFGEAMAIRTVRPSAKASVRSQSRSSGFDVAISIVESEIESGIMR